MQIHLIFPFHIFNKKNCHFTNPIAKVTSKIALGYTLDEIKNEVTGVTYACFEPTIDYVVVKVPKWPFKKFLTATRTLGTQMKATGEVMAIAPNLEAGLMKAIRSLEENVEYLRLDKLVNLDKAELEERLKVVDNERLFVIAEAIRKEISVERICELTTMDKFFIGVIYKLVKMEKELSLNQMNPKMLEKAKRLGFTDKIIAKISGKTEDEIKSLREKHGIKASFKKVDTCAGEFEAQTPYYYSSYDDGCEAKESNKKKVMVLGSGPIRIGQGIEFDYCSVHGVWALKKQGYETIIVNNNPETVSTDFDIADKLYFEPLTREDVENIVNTEKPDGAIVQFGGQTAIKLTKDLTEMGVKIMGTQEVDMDRAEDRKEFDEALNNCGILRPQGSTIYTVEEAQAVANRLGYPVLVRPSYVLGGQGMAIAFDDKEIESYVNEINTIAQEHPILVDKYIMGREVEVDAICDGEDILIPGIMEHLERAGVHSGDSISVYPTQNVSKAHEQKIIEYTEKIAKELNVIGILNIQFIISEGEVYIIEVNPRSSRTVPYISKVTNLPMIDVATNVILGKKLKDLGYGTGLYKKSDYICVKMPVFSFEKIKNADTSLGPEMKSTGEVLGVSKKFENAVLKAFIGSGVNVSKKITSQKERARLKSIVSLLKPVGVGVIVRTEAEGQSDAEIQEDLEILLEKWNSIVNAADSANPPTLLYRDQDLLYRVIREACDSEVEEIVVDTAFALHRTTQLLQHWNMQVRVSMHKGTDPLLVATGVNKEIEKALNTRVNLPLGGYLFIQQTEALTVVDVNSGKFTSSSNQAETILKTNIQAADEIARQLKLRNIGGMVIVDFIDMASRMDKLALLEHFEIVLEKDKAKPQIGQLSDLGLVELTRHRQGQSLSEIFTKKCDKCNGQGFIIDDLKFATPTSVGENRAKLNKIKGPFGSNFNSVEQAPNQNNNKNHKFDKNNRRDKNKNRQQNREQNQDFNQEIVQEFNQEPIQEQVQNNIPEQIEVQELTKTKVNELIDDLIKDVIIDEKSETNKEIKEEIVENKENQQEKETSQASEEIKEDKKEEAIEVKKLSRKAKKTKKKEDKIDSNEQNPKEEANVEEKPKKRVRRTKSAKATT